MALQFPLVPSTPDAPWLIVMGGLDPGGGAGLLRDVATVLQRGGRPWAVGTAWTEQSRAGVRRIEPRDAAAVEDALSQAQGMGRAGRTAVKIGMVARANIAQSIASALANSACPVVFDPVLGASSGGGLFEGDLTSLAPLVRRATLVTPNLGELAAMTGLPTDTDERARVAGERLLDWGAHAVLVKGGHRTGDAIDLLIERTGTRSFFAPRVPGPSPRGTGCALASAIAVELAQGQYLADAVTTAKAWLRERIVHAVQVGDEWHLG